MLNPSEVKSSPSPAALKNPLGSGTTLGYMKAAGLPLTRENYLALAFPGEPEFLPWELELQIPEMFRLSPSEWQERNDLLEPSPDL